MPTFTFTSPDGKQYSVDGPDGSTKEQAFSLLQQRLAAQKQGVAAPANAADATAATPPARQTLGGAVKEIAKSGAIGTALGAAAPEIITGVGMASAAIPVVGEFTAPALIATGRALRGARLAEAVTGGISGIVSETAGQVADASGASPGKATAVRIAAGVLSPTAALTGKFVTGPVKTLWGAVQRFATGSEESVPAAVNAAREKLAASAEAGKPQLALHAALQEGVEADRKAADAAASARVAEAHQQAADVARTDEAGAQRLVEEGRVRADQIRSEAAKRAEVLRAATNGKLDTAKRVYALTQPELAKVGEAKELSDIGQGIRDTVTAQQGAEMAARRSAYQATLAQRDAVVSAKEAAGQTIDQTQGLKDLKQELSTKLLNTKAGRAAAKGMAQVTEPGVAGAYQRVYDSIINKRVQTGVDENGNATYQTFKTSFEALDHVRRKLGDVVAKKDVEGYSAIGSKIAADLYGKIAKIEEDYAGPAQKTLQDEYHASSEELSRFGTKAGRKVTAMDRVDPSKFAGDPKDIPKEFFSSKQGVQNLRELTGNAEVVNRMAEQYAARSLDGLSAKQASAWAKSNSDWLREVPGLQGKVNAYASKVAQIERVGGKLEDRAATAAKERKALGPAAEEAATKEQQQALQRAQKASEGSVATQQRIREMGAKEAEQLKAERFGASEKLDRILKGGEAPEAARSLLLTAKPEVTRKAATILAGVPGGKAVLDSSVRQVLRNMPEKQLQQQWTERVLPMLRDGQMLPPAQLQKLEADVQRVLKAYSGKKALTAVQQYVVAALAAGGGAVSKAAGQ